MPISTANCRQAIVGWIKNHLQEMTSSGFKDVMPQVLTADNWKRRKKQAKHDAFGQLASPSFTMRLFELSLDEDDDESLGYYTWDDGNSIVRVQKKLGEDPADHYFYVSPKLGDFDCYYFYVTTISYWKESGYCSDWHMDFKDLPFGAADAMEACYEFRRKNATPQEMHAALIQMGFVYDQAFADFMVKCDEDDL